MNTKTLKTILLGVLANMLGLLSFIILIYLGLIIFNVFFTTIDELAQAQASGTLAKDQSLFALLGQSTFSSLQNGLKGLWDVRWGFVAYGIMGAFAAAAYQASSALRFYREHAWLISFICLTVINTVSLIIWVFTQRNEILVWLAEAPEVNRWGDMLLRSYTTDISVSLIFALALTYPIWAAWQWWYQCLLKWFALTPSSAEAEITSVGPDSTTYTTRLYQLKRESRSQHASPQRSIVTPVESNPIAKQLATIPLSRLIIPLAGLLILCLVSIRPLSRYHDQVAIKIQHGRTFVNDERESHQVFAVQVHPEVRKIRVVNIKGLGRVSLYLSPSETDYQAAVAKIEDWSFKWRMDEFIHEEVSLVGVEPGPYHLHFVQEEGWGFFEYTLSHGGGRASHIAAFGLGFLVACSVMLGLALVVVGGARVVYMLR